MLKILIDGASDATINQSEAVYLSNGLAALAYRENRVQVCLARTY